MSSLSWFDQHSLHQIKGIVLASELAEGYPQCTRCVLMVADAQDYPQRAVLPCFCIEYWPVRSEAKQLVCYLHLYKSPCHLFIKQGQIHHQVCNVSFLLHLLLRQASQESAVQEAEKKAQRWRAFVAIAEDLGSVATIHRMRIIALVSRTKTPSSDLQSTDLCAEGSYFSFKGLL